MEQVLRDLIDNAIRFSPSGGAVTVELVQVGEMAEARVRDEGIGIGEKDREHVFEYLYRAPEAESRNLTGLGLGLFVSQAIIERLGGRLWLEAAPPKPQKGSEFRFTLPLA